LKGTWEKCGGRILRGIMKNNNMFCLGEGCGQRSAP
jgi:hypothetical protein